MDIQVYLDRIKYYSEVKVFKKVLFNLQKRHLLNIPFENLDIHYGIEIKLEIKDVLRK